MSRKARQEAREVQTCKSAYGLCKGVKVGDEFRVAGGGPRWRVAGSGRGATVSRPVIGFQGGRVADASLPRGMGLD